MKSLFVTVIQSCQIFSGQVLKKLSQKRINFQTFNKTPPQATNI